MGEAERVLGAQAELGEGPVWSAREQAVWFVDVKGRRIHRFHPTSGEHRAFDAPEQASFVLPTADGGWVAGLQSGPHRFDPATGAFAALAVPEEHGPAYRLNDGAVDGQGRLWFGSMHDEEADDGGKLYRLDADGRARVQDRGYVVTNGPVVSPDGRTLYHTDTLSDVVYAFDLAEDGAITNKRPFVRITRPDAHPDGCFVDAEGCLWTGLFGGWGLERYSPAGELLAYVPIPCANVTKAAFGGEDLKTLYVTTAKLHLSPEQRAVQTVAGDLFAVRVDVPGLPQTEIVHGV